ncbi:MAG TPA: radical SAM protein [Polyangiaceae bacterium]|nr:radical SAM protein [Polyangiaceae bacterium]
MPNRIPARLIDERLRAEVGAIAKQAPARVALAYPSPYTVGMSSLGYQRIYRSIQETSGMMCERAFLPDGATDGDTDELPVTYESLTALTEFRVVAISVAYELEIAGTIRLLELSGIPPLREERDLHHPFILAGGPLTFSNPVPLAPYADAVIMGEAEGVVVEVLSVIEGAPSKAKALAALAELPHVFVPAHHGETLPPVAQCDDALLPAWGPIRTPNTELSNMFLIETERGCSRGCTYCVMRRSTNGGMRIVPKERILELIPEDARRVGLVGAAVSDHPKVVEIVRSLAERGAEVGLSSLRPDRLNDDFVGALKLAGYRTLTTAMDGPSERIRESLERRARVKHLERAADLARAHGMNRLKLYLMLGLPHETNEDIDECVTLVTALSRRIPLSLGIAPFCAKRNTPLDGAPFAGIDVVRARLERLRRGLKGKADVRSTSARWAWVEYILAQGGAAEGRAVLDAVHAGGTFAAYRKAFEAVAATPRPRPKRALPFATEGRGA